MSSMIAGLWREDIQLGLLWKTGNRDSSTLPSTVTDPQQNGVTVDSGWFPKLLSQLWLQEYLIAQQPRISQKIKEGALTAAETICLPSSYVHHSWSWISQFHRGIEFEHTRRYIREEEDGIQPIECMITHPPLTHSLYGEVLTAPLR
jgi:hypothetical protein